MLSNTPKKWVLFFQMLINCRVWELRHIHNSLQKTIKSTEPSLMQLGRGKNLFLFREPCSALQVTLELESKTKIVLGLNELEI